MPRADKLAADRPDCRTRADPVPPVGAHAVAPCESCHPGATAGQFRGAPAACDLCHQADLARATSPNHVASGWTTNCGRCHSPVAWDQAQMVHDFFPLVGGHAGLNCTQCHTSGALGPIPSNCYACHTADYQRAPDHAAQAFPHACEQCHRTTAWLPATYQHTSFPLTAGHAGLACTQCHTSGTLGPIPATCYSCHTTDYQRAPDHAAQAFPHTCEQCHSTAAWLPATYQHTAFPLTAGHAGLACTQCHAGGTTGPISSNCYSCHTTNYQQAPDHATLAFSHSCEQCHTTTAWLPSTYRHTTFALTGGHAGLGCSQCHTGGTLGPIPSNCYSCHTTDYQRAPDHAAQAFPHTCEQCHRTAAWLPAASQHTSFPLTAGHSGLACTQCHRGGTTGTIPSTCYSCHATNYQAAPDHAALAFSHSCEQCHTTTAWLPSTYHHTTFALTGGHAGLRCSQCHTGGTLGTISSACYSCHTNRYQQAPDHTALAFPHSCEQCHTTTAWLPSTFRHTFPRTGDHNVACTQCHTGGNTSTFNCLTCHTRNETDEHHHEVNGYTYSSPACYQCHPRG